MKISFLALLPLLPQTLAQSPTFTPTTTSLNVPRPFSTNPSLWSSIRDSLVSASIIPSTASWGPGYGPWQTDAPYGPGRGPGNKPFGGSGGPGPWGPNNWGPWSDWSTRSDWRTNGPWTNWWGGSACPGTDWPGWTQGPWSTNAPWTTWAGCTAKTTASSVVVNTVSGSAVTSVVVGVQVAQAEATGAASVPTAASVGAAAAREPVRTGAPLAAVAGVVVGFAMGF